MTVTFRAHKFKSTPYQIINVHADTSQVPDSASKTIPPSISKQLSHLAASSWLSVKQLLDALASLKASLSIIMEPL